MFIICNLFVLFGLIVCFVLCVQTRMPRCANIICGSFHQGTATIFSAETRGKQCVANCVQAAVYTQFTPLEQWTPAILDTILLSGDALYRESSQQGKEELLLIDEIRNPLHFQGRTFKIEHEENEDMYGTIHSAQNVSFGMTLLDAIGSISDGDERWAFGVLTLSSGTGGYAMLVCVHGQHCFLFDSHSRNDKGLQDADGTSVLLEFRHTMELVLFLDQLSANLKCRLYNLNMIHVTEVTSSGGKRRRDKTNYWKREKKLLREQEKREQISENQHGTCSQSTCGTPESSQQSEVTSSAGKRRQDKKNEKNRKERK